VPRLSPGEFYLGKTKGVRRVLPDSVARNDFAARRASILPDPRRTRRRPTIRPSDFIIETRAKRADLLVSFGDSNYARRCRLPLGIPRWPRRSVDVSESRLTYRRSSSIDGMRTSGSGIARVRRVHRDGVGSSFSDLLERLARTWLSIRHLIHAHVT